MGYTEGAYSFAREGTAWVARDAKGVELLRFGRSDGAATRSYLRCLTRWEAKKRSPTIARELISRIEHPTTGAVAVTPAHWMAVARAAGRKGEPALRGGAKKRAASATAPTTKPTIAAPAATKKPVKLAPVSKKTTAAIDAICREIEAFFARLAAAGLDVRKETLAPSSEAKIGKLAAALRIEVPEDLHAFWLRGLRSGAVALEDGSRSAFIGFDFINLEAVARSMKILRSLASDDDPGGPDLAASIPLTWSEPQLVVNAADGSVGHYSPRNPWRGAITGSLETFLRAWLAAGCFGSHDAALAIERLALVGVKATTAKNPWLRYYAKQFPQLGKRAKRR